MKFPVILLVLGLVSCTLFIPNAAKKCNILANCANNLNVESINYGAREDSTLEPFYILSEPIIGANINNGFSYSPKIAVEGDKLYVVWCDENDTNGCGKDSDVFFRYFDGSSWSDVQVISEPVSGMNISKGDCGYPDIAIEDGKIYVVWNDNSSLFGSGSDWDIFYRTNLSGSGWEDIQVISEPNVGVFGNNNTGDSYRSSIVVENGKVYVTWTDENDTNGCGGGLSYPEIFFRCNLTGKSWEDTQVISEPVFGQDITNSWSDFPDLAVDNDSIYIVWMDDNDTNNADGDLDIFIRYNLTGTSWEDIEVISEPILGQGTTLAGSWEPRIAVENGIIFVVWDDNNNTDGSNPKGNFPGMEDTDIRFRCNYPGIGWGVIQTISEPVFGSDFNIKQSDHSDIAVDSGKIHVVWEDYNDTNGAGSDCDIFYKRVMPLTLRDTNVVPKFGNSGEYFNFSINYVHNFNKEPEEIFLNISGVNYQMRETNPNDKNYLNGKMYYFNITHLDIGTHSYTFWASDGCNESKFPISNKITVHNTPPKIITVDETTAVEDMYYEVKYKHGDIDVKNIDQPIIWTFSSNAGWLTFDSTTAILNGTPTNDDVGKYWVHIIIDDTNDTDETNFTLNVLDVNDGPIIKTKNIEQIY